MLETDLSGETMISLLYKYVKFADNNIFVSLKVFQVILIKQKLEDKILRSWSLQSEIKD